MKADDPLIPVMMLVFYSNVLPEDFKNHSHKLNNETVYFEYAPIIDGTPTAFAPLSDEVSGVFARAMGAVADCKVGGFINPQILYTSFNGIKPIVAWYTEPQKRRLLCSPSLGIQTVTINLPWLLWVYDDKEVKMYACKEKPSPDTKLFHAPFPNVYEDGRVCLGGGTKVLDKTMYSFESVMQAADLAFFGTQFNHQHNPGIKGNLISLYKKMNGTDEPFPLNVLKPIRKTLKSVLKLETDAITTEEEEVFDEDIDFEED
jgi:PRTRC genetic system protein B